MVCLIWRLLVIRCWPALMTTQILSGSAYTRLSGSAYTRLSSLRGWSSIGISWGCGGIFRTSNEPPGEMQPLKFYPVFLCPFNGVHIHLTPIEEERVYGFSKKFEIKNTNERGWGDDGVNTHNPPK